MGAIGVVPLGVKTAHEADGFADFPPGGEIELRADVGRAAPELDLVRVVVEAEEADLAGVVAAKAEDQVDGGAFPAPFGPMSP
jgi:hypothetical protein